MNPSDKPQWWFRPIHEATQELTTEPSKIEYLKMWSGETFIHTGGTAYWDTRTDPDGRGFLDVAGCMKAGITHYRVVG